MRVKKRQKTVGGWGQDDFGWSFPQYRPQNGSYLGAEEDERYSRPGDTALLSTKNILRAWGLILSKGNRNLSSMERPCSHEQGLCH
jgi:hypothetical protein